MLQYMSVYLLLNKSDYKKFESYIAAKSKRRDQAGVKFFREYVKGNSLRLRENMGENAFNVAKKRMNDRLIDFISNTLVENEVSEEIETIKILLVARQLLQQQFIDDGIKLLLKCEKKAIKLQQYNILNEIYHTLIEYAHQSDKIKLEQILFLSQENYERLQFQNQLNNILAIVKSEIKQANKEGRSSDLVHIMEVVEHTLKGRKYMSFQLLAKLVQILDIQGEETKSYHNVDTFFEQEIKELQGSNQDTAKNLVYQLEALYGYANILLRQKKFSQSLIVLTDLIRQADRSKELHYLYLPRYIVLKSLCENFLGNHLESKKTLGQSFDSKYAKNELLNAYLTKIMWHAQQEQWTDANQVLAQLNRSDNFYERLVGLEWILNKKFLEIIINIELGNLDFVDNRILSLKRKYQENLNSSALKRIKPFIKLIQEMYNNPEIIGSNEFINKVNKSIDWKPREAEDLFFMCFYGWFKAKVYKRRVYETTLEIINGG